LFPKAVEQKMSDVCALPIAKGPCRALKFKFAYNKDTNRCEKFTYGGNTEASGVDFINFVLKF
jgi:hypothetical protein